MLARLAKNNAESEHMLTRGVAVESLLSGGEQLLQQVRM
jgi:hypothetical protein